MNHLNELKDKLSKAKAGWNYLWKLLEKEVKRVNLSTEVLTELYRYQVELDTDKHLLELYEKKLASVTFSAEDEEIVREGLPRYLSKFQAIAFSIENLLRE